jgi:hypothetical protein
MLFIVSMQYLLWWSRMKCSVVLQLRYIYLIVYQSFGNPTQDSRGGSWQWLRSHSSASSKMKQLVVGPSHQKKRRVTWIWCWFSRRVRLGSRESESFGESLQMTRQMTCQNQSFVCHFWPFLPFSGEILYISKNNFLINSNSWTKIWINHGKLTKWVLKWMTRESLKKSESSLSPAKIAKWLGSLSHDSVTRPTTRSNGTELRSADCG